MSYTNGFIEDLGAHLGTEASMRLMAVYGGRAIRIPSLATPDHPLCRILGEVPFRRLVDIWTDEIIEIPSIDEIVDGYRCIRAIARLARAGTPAVEIARLLALKQRQVINLMHEAVALKLLDAASCEAIEGDPSA